MIRMRCVRVARVLAVFLLLMAGISSAAMKGQALVHWMDYSAALEKAKKKEILENHL